MNSIRISLLLALLVVTGTAFGAQADRPADRAELEKANRG